jgi:hypothetical protein
MHWEQYSLIYYQVRRGRGGGREAAGDDVYVEQGAAEGDGQDAEDSEGNKEGQVATWAQARYLPFFHSLTQWGVGGAPGGC